MCARARVPANQKKGKSESKAQLKRRAEIEEMLKGNDNEVYSTPAYLAEEEQIYYQFLVNELKVLNILSNVDKFLLEQAATCLATIRQCDDHIRANGLLIPSYDKYGNIEEKENPSIKIKLNYMTKYNSICNQLSLSPASRASIAGKQLESKQQEEDPLLRILKGQAI